MADYIPRKDAELVTWSTNFGTQIASKAAVWGIPVDEVIALQTDITSFASLQAQADSPSKTAIIVAKKNAARYTLVAKIRAMANFRLKNPIITDAERIAMGLHVRDTTPTTVQVPKTRPELDVEVVDFRRLKLLFHDMGSKSKAKPYGITGAVIACAALDAPPVGPGALTRTMLATRTPHIIEFTEEERGKTVYIVACWQNEKGERGSWSEIISAIVP
jgi:hypothetical protein